MIETKLFEIRDTGTFIPAIASRIAPYDFESNSPERYLARRAGYGDALILLGKLEGGQSFYDPYDWCGNRTMQAAHLHIAENWNSLDSGDVVDVGFILGIYPTKKRSECEEFPL